MLKAMIELAEKRQRWIDANRENGFEEGIKRLLTELYPDNAHFIYELLQNAEDPGASEVQFTLSEDGIVFEHNGKRLFDMKDVESITSIGTSTKRDDPTSIGQFGVGFKAVFAYTNTPEIHSGDFHFRIRDLVVPVTEGVKSVGIGDQKTRFTFPFDHSAKRPSQAVKEIERALRALGNNTLLFLNHIRLIEYTLPDGSIGSLKRIDHENGHIEIHAYHPGGEDTFSNWLRYQKDVDVVDEDGRTKSCRIAVAYSIEQEDKKDKSKTAWKIIPLDQGQVSIYFPAEKETSNLRFHLHAPFASTVARDSVRDCKANHNLRDRIADLVVESLFDIRDRGMLTMHLLSVFPNPTDGLSSFYESIREAIVCAFKDESLTPTRSGGYAPASVLYRGPAKIAEVINDDGLSLLTDYEPPLWAANPPQQNQREDRFLDSLQIESWGWRELSESLRWLYEDERKAIEEWVAGKDDTWMMRFYALLGEGPDTPYGYVDVDNLRIVRVQGDQGHEHVLPHDAFFSPEQNITPPHDIRFVKHAVYRAGRSESQKKYSVLFLESIGVRPFDAKAIIELRLSKYNNPQTQFNNSYYKDLKQFLAYWKSNPADTRLFKKQQFLLGCNDDGKLKWQRAEQLCMDTPYLNTGLAELRSIHKKTVLWTDYKDKFNASQFGEFVNFLKAIGVMYRVSVSTASLDLNYKRHDLWDGLYGSRSTHTGISEDYSIDELSSYTKLQTVPASRLIWQALISAERRAAKARYRPNQQYPIREVDSQLICHLKNSEWIPDKKGVFRKPQDMIRDDLRTDFPYDDRNGLLTAIGFGDHAKKRNEEYLKRNNHAKFIGFDSADEAEKMAQLAQTLREKGLSADAFIAQFNLSPDPQEPVFPSRHVPNSERRQERLSEEFSGALEKEYEKRERSVRTTNGTIDPSTWLKNQYTNEFDQMVCQICKEEMPFKKRDGEYYFEKKEVLSRKFLPKEHEAQYLALCPLCAAKYEEFVKKDDKAMTELKDAIISAEDCDVPITLSNQETSIRFVETHFHDLKTILDFKNSLD